LLQELVFLGLETLTGHTRRLFVVCDIDLMQVKESDDADDNNDIVFCADIERHLLVIVVSV
jgi:hypothetical protein